MAGFLDWWLEQNKCRGSLEITQEKLRVATNEISILQHEKRELAGKVLDLEARVNELLPEGQATKVAFLRKNRDQWRAECLALREELKNEGRGVSE